MRNGGRRGAVVVRLLEMRSRREVKLRTYPDTLMIYRSLDLTVHSLVEIVMRQKNIMS